MTDKNQAMHIDEILTLAFHKKASDVHLKAGLVPVIRKHGRLRPLENGLPVITSQEMEEIAWGMMDDEQRKVFHNNKEIDLAYGVTGCGRFRVNVFRQRGSVRMVIRNIPFQIPSIEELNLPAVIKDVAENERGLILVTGVTGSGKSSTLASMIEHINSTKNRHILTIEDPIEFLIRDRKSIVSQRELGLDTRSFSTALRSALRQDPDIILIGEMRDKETIETALTAAETGHLVLSTLHTVDAGEAINRILTAFEPHQHPQIRLQIAAVLKAVISQRLARRKDNSGFIPAVEVMINTARTKDMIIDPNRTQEIHLAIEEGRDTLGTQTFDQCLLDLLQQDLITTDEALRLCTNPDDFRLRQAGVSSGSNQAWDKTAQSTTQTGSNPVGRVRENWERATAEAAKLEIDSVKYEPTKIKRGI